MKGLKTITFRSILKSYILICVMLLFLTCFGYISSISYMKREVEQSARLKFEEVAAQVEDCVLQTYKICDILAVGKEFRELASIEGAFSTEEIQETLKLREMMRQMDVQSRLYQDLHIYFCRSNSICSAKSQRREGDADLTFFAEQYGMEKAEFDRLMSMEEEKMYQILPGNRIWLLCPVYDRNGELEAIIFTEYSGEQMIQGSETENLAFIRAEAGESLLCIGKLSSEEMEHFAEDTEGEEEASFCELNSKGKRYIGCKVNMNIFNWKFYMAFPNDMFWSELLRFAVVLFLEVIISVAAAVFGCWYFSKRAYIPIGNLIRDNRKLSRKVQKNSQVLENMELIRYLNGVTDEFPVSCKGMKEVFNGDRECYFLAVLSPGEESSRIFHAEETGDTEENLEQFVLRNILEEQIFSHYPGLLLPCGRQYTVLLGLREDDKAEAHLKKLFCELEVFFRETFRIPICIILGKKERGAKGIKKSYDALCEGLLYLDFWSTRGERKAGVYVYGELIEEDENVNFSDYINGSRRLLNCLESEDFRGAYKELDLLYRETFPKNQKYLKYNIYRMYGLIGILIATLDVYAGEDEQRFYETLQYEERLFRIQSIHELLQESRDIFEQIIKYRENCAEEKGPEWLEELISYIEENYSDSELSVTKLAEYCGISVPHLSRSFKNQVGMGVLEYIHRIRIAKAKEMLKNDASIKNAALAVGYTDAQAITRAFKRYEGITPSQYKELISKNEA